MSEGRILTTIFLIILISIGFNMFLNKSNQVEQLEIKLQLQSDSLNNYIDSLLHEIDTLQF